MSPSPRAALLALALTAVGFSTWAEELDAPRAPRPQASAPPRPQAPARVRPRATPPRGPSRALGTPSNGRLVRGVRLPAAGRGFATWDPIERRSPNRGWRRHGTDRLVRIVMRVAAGYAARHPRRPPMLVGDLSRPRGGDFGVRYGIVGHASHQNGLDVDVYYPRLDRRERAPLGASQIDRRLSQELVDRFVAAGAALVLVGPGTGLKGPAGVVAVAANHDNHLHVRIRAS